MAIPILPITSTRTKNHTGERFGRLVVIGYGGTNHEPKAKWVCRCDCGRETVLTSGTLSKTKSCGCLLREKRDSFENRFWKHVHKTDGCWNWNGVTDESKQRGSMRRGRANEGSILVSHVSWIIHNGEIPPGLFVLHHCDNGHCVRPDHLYLGTQKQNMLDAFKRGRHGFQRNRKVTVGENNPNAKLTWEMVRDIRSKHQGGSTASELARFYQVTTVSIYHIVKNQSWVE